MRDKLRFYKCKGITLLESWDKKKGGPTTEKRKVPVNLNLNSVRAPAEITKPETKNVLKNDDELEDA